jgi:sugar phosphate isomerase/epimerase
MKFGACLWPFKWDPPYEDQLERVANLGFKSVELIAWNPKFLKEYYTPEKIDQILGLIDEHGLEISEFVGTPGNLAHPDKALRDEAVEFWADVVRIAGDLGVKTVNSVANFPFGISLPANSELASLQEWRADFPPDLDWTQNWRDHVEAVKRCCAICEDNGARWAMEPHPYRWVSNTAAMLRLIDWVDSPALGMNFDPSHLFPMGETPHASIYQLGDRIFNCHLSDNIGHTNLHWRPGKGRIDWDALLCALRDVGYDGHLSLELEDVPGVSRGEGAQSLPASLRDEPAETRVASFDRENLLSLEYLQTVARRNGIEIEGGPAKDPYATVSES